MISARRAGVTVILVLALGYIGLLALIYLGQDNLLYFPNEPSRTLEAPAADLQLREQRAEFASADGTRLVGWEILAAGDSGVGRWLLMLHGNAGSISSSGRPDHYRQLRDLGLNLLTFDYRGYGESEGKPSEAGLYQDATAAYEYLRGKGVAANRIVLYGHSLGSAVAIDLATRVPVSGLIVEGAFTSVADRGQEVYPFLPVRLLARSRFASIEKIQRVTCPLLVIHGEADITIPPSQGRRLFQAAREPKSFLLVAGAHDDAFRVGASAYEAGIRKFLASLDAE